MAGPLAVLVWFVAKPNRYVAGVFLTLLIPILLSEAMNSAQEFLLYWKYRAAFPGFGSVQESRWWPWSNHHVGYSPATGQFYAGC
jgi:hypothetical protein